MRRKAFVRIWILLVTILLFVSNDATSQHATGTVCVAARIDDPFGKEPAVLPDGKINSHGLRIKVDRRPAIAWPERKSLRIEGLDIGERHVLAVLNSDGRPVESVKFRFSQYSVPVLCLAYDGYQGIGLREATRRTPWCKCH